jgi:tetratricopeptide (TPR) repeat protein
MRLVCWLAELGKDDGAVAGGKGANLGALTAAANAIGVLFAQAIMPPEIATAIRLTPRPAWQNELAWLLATCPEPRIRKPQQAVELARAATRIPREGTFWNTLGVAYYRAGDWKAAVAAFDKSMELRAGGDAFDWLFLAMAHAKLGNWDEARKRYDQVLEWLEKNGPMLAKNPQRADELRRFRAEAKKLIESGPWQAVATYSVSLAFLPINPEAYLRRGRAYYQLKQYRQASDDLGVALALNPRVTEAQVWFELGYAAMASGRQEQALAAYSRTVELGPRFDGAWNNRGLLRTARASWR